MAANIHEEEAFGKPIDSTLLKRLLIFVKPYKKYVFLAVLLTISISALAAIRPAFTQIAWMTTSRRETYRGFSL